MHYANSVSVQYSHCSIGTLLLDREANKIDTFPMFFMLLSKYVTQSTVASKYLNVKFIEVNPYSIN